MTYVVNLSPKANTGLDRNWRYLENEQPGLGHDFLSRVLDATYFLEEYADISEVKGNGWRKVKMEKFNFNLWHRISGHEVVVLHGHQPIDFIS
jgi:hypothetical protein